MTQSTMYDNSERRETLKFLILMMVSLVLTVISVVFVWCADWSSTLHHSCFIPNKVGSESDSKDADVHFCVTKSTLFSQQR